MTSAGRAYVAAVAVLVFFVLWATISASPWASTARNPRADALARREAVVRQQAARARRSYEARWAAYRAAKAALGTSSTVAAPAPPVRVVQLPPVATTRSS